MHTGRNFHQKTFTGRALSPQSIATADTAVNGPAITEPQEKGRILSFLLLLGAIASGGSLTVNVQQRLRSDGSTWSNMKESDGTTDLEFTQTDMDDGDDDTRILGSIPLDDWDSETYDAIRLQIDEDGTSSTVLVSAAYIISDLHKEVSGETDDLFSKVHPAVTT